MTLGAQKVKVMSKLIAFYLCVFLCSQGVTTQNSSTIIIILFLFVLQLALSLKSASVYW
jgi:hypothetical protein